MPQVTAYKVDTLVGVKPDSIVALKVPNENKFELYVTSRQGVPFPLNIVSTSDGISNIINTDGSLDISGTSTITISVSNILLNIINSALQAGDNISELLNDVGYITTTSLPVNTSDLVNNGEDGSSPYTTEIYVDTSDNLLDNRITILESLQNLETNFTGQAFAIWTGVGFIYDVIYPDYYIEGVLYSGATEQITLDISDVVNPRQDVIAVDATGAIKITGTADINPLVPTIDSETQIYITTVLVNANATTPVITEEAIYKENTEWMTVSNNGTVNFNATSTPFQGTKYIDCGAFTDGQYLRFTDNMANQIVDFYTLKFYLNLKAAFTTNTKLMIRFYNAGILVSSSLKVNSGSYNFNRLIINTYQTIAIPLSAFTFTNSEFDRVDIVMVGTNALGFKLDNIILSADINNVSPKQNSITTITTGTGIVNATTFDDVISIQGTGKSTTFATGKTIYVATPTEVSQTIINGVTTTAPSEDKVFNALIGKQNQLTAGTNIIIDVTNPLTPIINSTSSGTTNLAYTASPTNGIITSDTGTDATLPTVDGTNSGLMTPTQKTKLDGIATEATANSSDATLLARANHTGTQLSSTISDFNSATDARVVAGITGKADLLGSTLEDFQVPTIAVGANSAVSKSHLDNIITGITWKNAVKVASTGNLSLSGTSNVDDTTIPSGTRILVKNQITQTENGIYISATGAWTRATDADSDLELETSTVAVTTGTVNKNTQWTCITTGVIIGSTAINFGQISGAGTYTNGNGIDLTANVFSINSSVATLNGTQTLINKTLTSPIISTPIGLVKTDVGLSNVDNTSDANKPISTAQATAIGLKQDAISLTTNGSSGASTLIGSTLNIPQYTGGSGTVTSVTGTNGVTVATGTTTPVIGLGAIKPTSIASTAVGTTLPILSGKDGFLFDYIGTSTTDTGTHTNQGVLFSQTRATGTTVLLTNTYRLFIANSSTTFNTIGFNIETVSVGNALVFEYWNGTAWTAVSGLTDGTSNFTQSGTVTFTMPVNWALSTPTGSSYNGYYIKIRSTVSSSTDAVTRQILPITYSGNDIFRILPNNNDTSSTGGLTVTKDGLVKAPVIDGATIFTNDVTIKMATSNTITYFNSGGVLSSLPTGTYPNLTELSYVKGVNSPIQTQLADKASLTSPNTFSGVNTFLTGTIGHRNVANTFTSFFTNTNTASRTYTLPDRTGTLADNSDLALKADIASPALTGTPLAPTATLGTNTTQIATTAFVTAATNSYIIQAQRTNTNFTLSLTDAFTVIPVSSNGGYTITIPTNASVAFPIGTKIEVTQISGGTGQTFIAGSGVTILGNITLYDGDYTTFIKVATNTWTITGQSKVAPIFSNFVTATRYVSTLGSEGFGTAGFNKFYDLSGGGAINAGATNGTGSVPHFKFTQSYPFSLNPNTSTGQVVKNVDLSSSYTAVGGDTSARVLNLEPTINQSGGASGIIRALYINPTLTSAADFRAIEVTTGKVIIPAATQSNQAVNLSQVAIQLKDFYTDTNNTSTTETDLQTYTIAANRLNATGEKIVAIYGGTFNDPTATSQIQVYYGGQLIGNTGALTMSVTGAWVINVSVIRTGTTTARTILNISTPGASTAGYTKYESLTGIDFTGTNIIKVTGTAAGATGGSGDMTGTYGNIQWQPAAP